MNEWDDYTSLTEVERRRESTALFHSAFQLQMSGKLDAAVALYTKSIELFPTAEAFTFRGWTYSMMGRLDDAIEECHRAIQLDPDFGNPYNDIGAYLIEKKRPSEAIPWLRRALLAPRYESYHYPYCNLGRIYEDRGEWLKAMYYYSRALVIEPRYQAALTAVRRLQTKLN